MASSKSLRLILGDQLNHQHSWFHRADNSVTYVLMEVLQETAYVKHHIQKVAAFFAAMRSFADWLRKTKHKVIYIQLDDPDNRQTFDGNIRFLLKKHSFDQFEYLLPDEYRLDQQLAEISDALPVTCRVKDTEHFLTSREDLKEHFAGKKQYLMESFYRAMRKKHDILMVNGKPEGGKWNYDSKNRNRYDGKVPLPRPALFRNDVKEIIDMLEKKKVVTFGEIDPGKLIWPVRRDQALKTLNWFLKKALPHFGTYQDAMTGESWSLFHSRISFALNSKMIHPMEVIKKTLETWQENKKDIDIAQVEGFNRQILGWREFMRGIYWTFMPEYSSRNYFGHKATLPDYYWTADTKMNCMHHAIKQSLDYAYAHHIQRLMVTGNFALLAGIHPDQVDSWYLGVYIDAIEWVEITNTRGMSQFADGGIIATKPYVSTANYIDKMSNYCDSCTYDRKLRYGDKACPFNSFYWDFFERNRKRLSKNPRIGMMYRTWDKMSSEEQSKIKGQAKKYKQMLEDL